MRSLIQRLEEGMPSADMTVHVKGGQRGVRLMLGGLYGTGWKDIDKAVTSYPPFSDDSSDLHQFKDKKEAKKLLGGLAKHLARKKELIVGKVSKDMLGFPILSIKVA